MDGCCSDREREGERERENLVTAQEARGGSSEEVLCELNLEQ